MEEQETPKTDVQPWLTAIAAYDKAFKKWEGRVEKIQRRYRDDGRTQNNTQAKFNVLWSNVQTVMPAVFARMPKPDVSRRFADTDPVGRVASLIVERCLDFEIEHYPDYRAALTNCVRDRFLGGRGVAWVRYEPHFGPIDDGFQITEDADEAEVEESEGASEEIKYECAPVDYVHWRDFGHKIARTWEEVTAVWRKVYMSRLALVDRFGEDIGNAIPLDTLPKEQNKMAGSADIENQALIYEIWDKESGKAYWLSVSMGQILDERDDPLGLENFFPCPKPLYATLTTDSLEPIPDFIIYQDQADTLDTLADRIAGLVESLRVRGVYDASVPELKRLLTEGENNSLIPVKNWGAFSEKQGLKGAIDLVEVLPIAQALAQAYQAFEQVKGQIHELTGLSDILRGQSDSQETATAQQLKGQYGSMRLKAMQAEVAQFAGEILRIKAQIMCQHFQPQTLLQMAAADQLKPADQQLIQPALQLLSNEPLRSFRIEVQADSMVLMDEQLEKTNRLEFLKSAGGFLREVTQSGMLQDPKAAALIVDMLKFGVTGFKVGRTIEGEFDQVADQLRDAAQQPKQPKPDPEMMKIQADSQARQQEMQQKASLDAQHLQMTMQAEAHKQEMQARQIEHQNQIEAQREQLAANNAAALQKMQMEADVQKETMRYAFERWKTELQESTKMAIAQIAAKTQMDQSLLAAQQSANQEVVTDLEANNG